MTYLCRSDLHRIFRWLCDFACLVSRGLCCLLRFDLLPYCSLHAVESGVDLIRSFSLPIDLIEIFTFVKLQFGDLKSFVTTPFRFEDLEMVRLHVMLVLVVWVLNCLDYSLWEVSPRWLIKLSSSFVLLKGSEDCMHFCSSFYESAVLSFA